MEGAAKITRITARYRIVECLYLQRSSAATTLLEQAVIRLYTTILKYLVQARRYFQQRTGIRILKSGVLAQNDFQDLLQKMDADEREADHCADLVRTEMANESADQFASLSLEISNIALLRDALDRIEQPISQTVHRLEQVEDYLNSRLNYSCKRDPVLMGSGRYPKARYTRLALLPTLPRSPHRYPAQSRKRNLSMGRTTHRILPLAKRQQEYPSLAPRHTRLGQELFDVNGNRGDHESL